VKIRFMQLPSILVLGAALWLTACGAINAPPSEPASPVETRIKPLIETLKLNMVALEESYQLLRASAANHAFLGGGEQLDVTQKTAFFVKGAIDGARHQWEVLAIVDYIRSEAMRDYFTLRAEGLKSASSDLALNITLVDLYGSFIAAEMVQSDVALAMERLRAVEENYARLLAEIAPLSNAAPSQTVSATARQLQ
jgi:hypothetical protein